MKKLLLIIAVGVSTLAFGQSNKAGTIHANVGFGLGFDFGSSTQKIGALGPDISSNLLGAQLNYGLNAEYGIAEFVSAGIFVRGIASGTKITQDGESFDVEDDPTLQLSGMAFGVRGSFYAVNNDHFNLYFSPSFGYTPLSANLYDEDEDKINSEPYGAGGIVYGLNAGVRFYIGDVAGMFFDLGYTGSKLSIDNSKDNFTSDISLHDIGLTIGVALKFGK